MSIIWLLPLIFTVCKSPYELVRTGPGHPALPKEAEVKVVSWSDINSYDQIALVDVGEFTLEKRIKYAQDAARAAGGEFIAPRLSGDAAKNNKTEYLVQSFAVLKKKTAPVVADTMPKVSGGDDAREIAPPDEPQGDLADGGDKKDYSALPRASYRMLLTDYASLKGENFRGSLYPVKYFRTPPALKNTTGTGNQLLMLSSRQGSAKVLLVVPREKYAELNSRIKSKKQFNFVYTPVTVFKSKYPVLKYVDEIKQ
jgi:hypothetical protein